MVDENYLLDHANFIGLYLAVLDRRDLKLVERNIYNTSTIPIVEGKNTFWNYRSDFF